MRFAYIDSQGKEVGIPTVDALRLRIALKAIVEDTVFFDASTERWAPAAEHEVFRTLRKELAEEETDAFVAGPPSAMGAEEFDGELELEEDGSDAPPPDVDVDGGEDDDSEYRFAISNAPADGDAGRRPSAADPPSDPGDDLEAGLEEIEADPFANEAQDEPGEDSPPTSPLQDDEADPTTPIGSSSWVDLDMEGEVSPVFDLSEDSLSPDDPVEVAEGPLDLVPEMGGKAREPEADVPSARSSAPEPPSPAAQGPPEGLTQDRFDFEGMVEEAGWGDEPPPVMEDFESTEARAPDPVADESRSPERPRDTEPPLPSREDLQRRSGAARGDAPSGPGRGPRSGPPPRRAAASRRGATPVVGAVVIAAVLGVGGWWFLGRDATAGESDPPEPPPVEIPTIPADLEPRMREVADEVRASTLEELRDLPALEGVPAEPNSRWLAGEYLANAGRFPDVATYWSQLAGFLRVMQAAEDSVFRALLDERLTAADIPSDERSILEERILAGFRASARDRGVVFQRAREVSDAASRLHTFLVENEAEIAWEPGQSGLSSDPVVEAVPSSPAVGNQMWELVDDITAAMDALDFLDRVTTERFVGAVIERLSEIPVR